MKKSAIIFLISVLITVFCLSAVACCKEENTVKGIQIESDDSGQSDGTQTGDPSEGTQIQYSDGAVRVGKEILFNIISEAVRQSYGQSLSVTQKNFINGYIETRIIKAFTGRKFSENDFMSVIRVIDKNSAKLVQFFADLAEDKKVLQVNVEPVQECFSQFAVILGAENAALLCYDFLLGYLDYKTEDYLQKYESMGEGYEFYLQFAQDYKLKKETVVNCIGESNFIILLRLAYANKDILMSLFSQDAGNNAFGKYSEAQIQSYLNAQGDLLGRITVSAEGWHSIFSARFSWGNDIADDILQVAAGNGDLAEFAQLMPRFINYTADCLKNIGIDEAAEIKSSGAGALIRFIIRHTGYEQGVQADRDIADIFNEADYTGIVEKHSSIQQYREYIYGSKKCTFEELYEKFVQGDDATVLQSYLNYRLPVFAFLIYANAGN